MSLLCARLSFKSALAILGATLVMPSTTMAFDARLSDEALREAYFLGQRRDNSTARFLETYRHYLAAPKSGPHVLSVELFTPFAEAVQASRNHGGSYSAQQAREDYRARGESLRVGVHVGYTNTYSPVSSYSSNVIPGQAGPWRDFQVQLKQNGKILESRNARYEGTRMGGGGSRGGNSPRLTGFIIWLEYDALTVASGEATIEVDTPDGQHIADSFDLSQLR